MAGQKSRKILFKLMLHTNKTRIPRKQAKATEVESSVYRKTSLQESQAQKLHTESWMFPVTKF